MSTVNMVKVNEYLDHESKHQGKRCLDARNSDDGDIIAAAIAGSCLQELLYVARSKVLGPADIQRYLDGFMGGAKMEEREGRMGGWSFFRIGSGQSD